ncbi:hypothetical protein MTO96_025585 [Rhipicephalus appendiculatus]
MRADAATERGAAPALQGRAGRSPAGRGRCWLQNDYPVGDVLGGLAAVPAVGPAAPVFSGGPGAKVVIGATSMGPAVLGRVGRLVPPDGRVVRQQLRRELLAIMGLRAPVSLAVLHVCGQGGGAGLLCRFPPSLPAGLYGSVPGLVWTQHLHRTDAQPVVPVL